MHDLSKLRIERKPEPGKAARLAESGKAILVVAGAVFAVIALIFVFRSSFRAAQRVEVARVTAIYPSQASALLTASGYVVAQRKAAVASKGTGQLAYLAVEEGMILKKGQIIGRLESEDMEAALAQAKANWEVTKASLAEAQANLKRQQALLQAKLISQAEFDITEAQHRRAAAMAEAAHAAVHAAEVAVENTRIRAPFDGTILTKEADVGEIVAPFGSAGNSRGAVVTMADMSSLQVEADVSESNIERIHVGQPCEIILDAFPERRHRGAVHMIVPTADRAKATVLTKVRFLDKDSKVFPEMSAKVYFLSQEISTSGDDEPPKLALIPSAVIEHKNQKVTLVVREGRVIETPVVLGEMIGGLVEVTDGLSSGDLVVVKPTKDLKPGMKVEVSE